MKKLLLSKKNLKVSAKHLSNENYSAIIDYLKKNAPKPTAANH